MMPVWFRTHDASENDAQTTCHTGMMQATMTAAKNRILIRSKILEPTDLFRIAIFSSPFSEQAGLGELPAQSVGNDQKRKVDDRVEEGNGGRIAVIRFL